MADSDSAEYSRGFHPVKQKESSMRFPAKASAVVFAAVFCLGMVGARSLNAGEIKIAFIDMTRALNEVEEGKAELGKLESWQKEEKDRLEKKEKDLLARKETLQKEEGSLTPDAYRAKVEVYLKDVEDFQREKMDAAKDLQGKLAQATVYVKRRMDLIIAEIAEKEGYYEVVDITEGGVIYYPPSMDITNEVIRQYNKRYPLGSGGGSDSATPKKSGKAKKAK
jgi:outer membrane protein